MGLYGFSVNAQISAFCPTLPAFRSVEERIGAIENYINKREQDTPQDIVESHGKRLPKDVDNIHNLFACEKIAFSNSDWERQRDYAVSLERRINASAANVKNTDINKAAAILHDLIDYLDSPSAVAITASYCDLVDLSTEVVARTPLEVFVNEIVSLKGPRCLLCVCNQDIVRCFSKQLSNTDLRDINFISTNKHSIASLKVNHPSGRRGEPLTKACIDDCRECHKVRWPGSKR